MNLAVVRKNQLKAGTSFMVIIFNYHQLELKSNDLHLKIYITE